MIQIRDLRVDYDQVCAVRDVSFSVGAGEVFGLIGPNGAGKTSTLRAIAGLMEPTYGDIVLGGADISLERERAERKVGFMPDSAPLYDDLLVWEYLDMFAASYNIPATARPSLVARFLALVDLSAKRESLTAGLSRGMKQRLLLAKTLIPEPEILLLDEPASGMDPHGRALLKDVIHKLADEGRSIIVSSHILTEMSEFCTSVGIMERGQLVLSGPVDEVSRRVLGYGLLSVGILDGSAMARSIIEEDTRAGAVREANGELEFTFDGDSEAASQVLARLVTSGVQVSSFSRKAGDLEDVFLKVGAREVS